jgi:hypothetical protein
VIFVGIVKKFLFESGGKYFMSSLLPTSWFRGNWNFERGLALLSFHILEISNIYLE